MKIKKPSWLNVMFEWLLLGAIAFTIFVQVASGYSWTLPVIGVVPGPPSSIVTTIFGSVILLCILGVIVFSIPVLIFGSWSKRIIGIFPLLGVVTFAVMLIYSRYN